jgi:hypothetical protein
METISVNERFLGLFALLAFLAASPANAQGIKWHPGHYAMLLNGESWSQHLTRINELGKEASIKGVVIRINWAKLETSKGVYNFAEIDSYLSRLKAQPTKKRLILIVMDRRFGGTSSSGIVPTYLTTESTYHGGLVKTNKGYAARLWEKPVMDRLITLHKVIGARYDKDMYFEGIATEETTLSLPSPFPSGYTSEALAAQWTRLAAYTRAAMPQTNFFLNANWIGTPSLMGTLVQSLIAPRAGVSSSNLVPGKLSQGQAVWTGVYGADYRGRLAIANSVESSELGGSKGDFTPKQINDYAYSTLRTNYLFWSYNTWEGDWTQRWSTGILPFLRTYPSVRTACPSNYGYCMTW